jgi:hypothetical protein
VIESPQRRRILVAVLVSSGLAGAFYAILRLAELPVLPPADQLERVDGPAVALYALLTLVGLGLKMVRWQWQLEPIQRLPLARVLSANLLGNAALVLLPFRTGEAVRPTLIARGGDVSFLAAAASSVAERLIDALIVGAVLIGCLRMAPRLDPLPDHVGSLAISAAVVPTLAHAVAVAAVAGSAAVLAVYACRNAAVRCIRRGLGGAAPRVAGWLEAKLIAACRGLEFIASWRFGAPFALCSIGYWLLYWVGTWYILEACGFEAVGWARAGVVAGVVAFGMAGPNAPGFFGSFQAAAYAALALFYPASLVATRGAVAVFWMYVINLGCLILLVPVALWFARATAPGQPGFRTMRVKS